MSTVRQVLAGIFAGVISLIIIIGGLSLALAEASTEIPLAPFTETPLILPSLEPGAPTYTPSPVPSPTATPTQTPDCPIPLGWEAVTVTSETDLSLLAQERGLALPELLAANCLTTDELVDNSLLFVPPLSITTTPSPTAAETATTTAAPTNTALPSATPAPVCVPNIPSNWIPYTIQPNDTLFGIAQAHGTTVAELQWRNCIVGTTINVGKILYVPFVATPIPTPTFVPTDTLTPTTTPVTPTDVPTLTSTPTDTSLPPTVTDTPLPSDTPTLGPTNTSTPVPLPPTSTPTP
ncbi:MAG: LysM peptidoglycan-binding domain-containing protein [Anaerolineales bacterium]|nr:LysM peptidoglycan-binding domain-containing protein [Anaerolineales bacterium]